ncbi:unnamed protein product, partial [Ectocarpus sp. 13 AM-2016]
MGKHVFVTVGTTKFDSLVQAVDNAVVLSTLCSKGFKSLTVQIGHGQHVPSFPVDQVVCACVSVMRTCVVSFGRGESRPNNKVASDNSPAFEQTALDCGWYRFKQTLHEDMARADVVVSHAGAGCVMEALGE